MSKRNVFRSLKFTLLLVFASLMLSTLSIPQANAANATLTNDIFWKDTSGNPIYSQGGNILKVGNTYYWYGVKYNGAVTYYNNPTNKNGDTQFLAVTCYSSTDLVNWTFRGNVITGATDGSTWDVDWLGRLGVVYNENTQQYVLLTQYTGPEGSGTAFATSSTPTGAFTFHHVQTSFPNVVNNAPGDQSTFVDDNGKAYLVFSNVNGRKHLYVAELRPSDYLNINPPTYLYTSQAGGREGNAMFKNNGLYYLCSSDLHGWNSSKTYCISSSSITGPYSSEFVMTNSDKDYSHVTQTGFFIKVQGTAGTTILMAGDRWSNFAGNGLGYNQWMPITFNGTTPVLNSLSQFNLDSAAGTWSVAQGNNYVMNPSYEADRIALSTLTGWNNWTNVSADPNSNISPGRTGKYSMNQWSSSAYNASMYQYINLPNGTYTLKAWVRSGGGQPTAHIYVKNYGGTEKNYSINNSISSWTEVTIPNIVVTNGYAEIGVFSIANANQWLRVDDWSLTKS
ncbi:family 43 glycosylhydrolase [Paenibacillus luteus]|uniref:family 43 glycosylhydrolase n=1 Tax=Paenibacillus luteus TaxID=2545753 RepID=UPI001144487A|nr:family 43 glycosylhydrolase [Paenibacillus luteus]